MQEIDFAVHLAVEKVLIDLPEMDQCKSVDNLARILNKYLQDIQLIQKFLIRIRVPGNDEEAEKMFSRYI